MLTHLGLANNDLTANKKPAARKRSKKDDKQPLGAPEEPPGCVDEQVKQVVTTTFEECDLNDHYSRIDFDETLFCKNGLVAHAFEVDINNGEKAWDFFLGTITLVTKKTGVWVKFEDYEIKLVCVCKCSKSISYLQKFEPFNPLTSQCFRRLMPWTMVNCGCL